MRQEDRERLPIGIVPLMAMGVAPMAAWRGIIGHRRRCRLGGLRRDRGTRHADRRFGLCRGRSGLRRRCGRWRLRILGAARKISRKREQSCNGNAREMVSHLDHPLSGVIPGWSEGPDLRCAIAHRGISRFSDVQLHIGAHAEPVIGRAFARPVGAPRNDDSSLCRSRCRSRRYRRRLGQFCRSCVHRRDRRDGSGIGFGG